MLLVLVLILILVWAAVVWSIYSNFLVFYSNFSESENYHKAYYNSIAALERAELVTRQRGPWYEWNGWWILWNSQWVYNNWWSDKKITSNFSYLSDDKFVKKSSIFRDIKSRTTRIPAIWNWDVEFMLAYKAPEGWDDSENSSNYNMMDYKDSEIFLMYYDDNNDENPYTKIDCQNWGCTDSKPTEISWKIRLPKYIKEWFIKTKYDNLTPIDPNATKLDTEHPLIQHSALPKNDAIVDWQIRWNYTNSDWSFPFSVFASQRYSETNGVYKAYDSAIRESHINDDLSFRFSNGQWSPITDSLRWDHSEVIIISPQEEEILLDLKEHNKHFENIFVKDKYTNKQLRFSLLNLLQAQLSWMIYPFLEYYVDFWTDVSDKYFTINAEWNYDDYKINTIIRKPTIKESILWNFTTIF